MFPPVYPGSFYVTCRLLLGDERWTNATYCIDECALVKGLRASTTYRFRVAAINQFGTSPYSWASVEIKTKDKGERPDIFDMETAIVLRALIFTVQDQQLKLFIRNHKIVLLYMFSCTQYASCTIILNL